MEVGTTPLQKQTTASGRVLLEAASLFRLTWPTAISVLLLQTLYFVSLVFCSHIDEDSSIVLDAVGFSISVINVSAFSVAIGMGSAVDTLAAQAYGAKNFKKVGVYLQRAILILLLCTIPVYVVWFNLGTILKACRQSPRVVDVMLQYLYVYSTCLPALFVLFQIEKYLRAQNIVYPFVLTGLVANVVNVLLHVLFVLVLRWGVRGAAAAVSLATHAQLAALLLVIRAAKLHKLTWGGWTREALVGWGQFMHYGLPGFFMLAIEEWSFELGLLVSGVLVDGILQQGVYTVINTVNNMLFTIPTSLSIAITVRTGNEIGAGECVCTLQHSEWSFNCMQEPAQDQLGYVGAPIVEGNVKAAKLSVYVGIGFCVVWSIFVEVILLTFNSYIPAIFTADRNILDAMSLPMYVLSITALGDVFQIFAGGIMRGIGYQVIGATSNVFCYWLTGVPIGIVLATVGGLGATGYWIGLGVAVVEQFGVYSVCVMCANWKKVAENATRNATASDMRSRDP